MKKGSADEMNEGEIDENLADSFPASDPPSWTLGTDHKEESPDPENETLREKTQGRVVVSGCQA